MRRYKAMVVYIIGTSILAGASAVLLAFIQGGTNYEDN
jgi:hypothetical protein